MGTIPPEFSLNGRTERTYTQLEVLVCPSLDRYSLLTMFKAFDKCVQLFNRHEIGPRQLSKGALVSQRDRQRPDGGGELCTRSFHFPGRQGE
jgi:hypothetical protein